VSESGIEGARKNKNNKTKLIMQALHCKGARERERERERARERQGQTEREREREGER
jgi:hypothetical protein